MRRKLRMGMVGGGEGASIGPVHRMAARLDGLIELTAGAFSSTRKRALESGRELLSSEGRVYGTYQEMLEQESDRDEEDRIDFVSIVTPNDQHYPVAKMALEAGFPVVCDKPLTATLEQATLLQELVEETGLLFALTHNYTGYPMVKEARHRVSKRELGTIRKVVVEYPQGWLATPLEASSHKQASWRMDPRRSGASCCVGDIGTHAANLAEYVTGLRIQDVCADLTTFVKGRSLDDDASVLLRFEGGARGVLVASQISVNEENGLQIHVYGDRGGLRWRQEEPNTLQLQWLDRPRELLRTGVNYAYLSEDARRNTRLPAGHPEGFIEAFANVYRNFALTLMDQLEGRAVRPEHADFPDVRDGVRGMAFIEAVVESSKSSQKWIRMPVF